MPGTASTNSLVWSTNGGISRVMISATVATPPSSATSAPTGRGMPRRSRRVAAAASGMANTIVIRIASSSVTSWRNSSPNSSRPAASSTAR